MSITRVPFGPSIVESGKNKGQPRTIAFTTGIKPEQNAQGWPVVKTGKGENFAQLVISAGMPTRLEFGTADDVRNAAGDHLDSFLVSAANDTATAKVRAALTTEARKWSTPPGNLSATIESICNNITPESLFVPTERGGAVKGVKAAVAQLAASASEMSKDELIAALLKMAG